MSEVTQEHKKSVTDYLTTLDWDGIPRLDRWLIDCAGAEDTSYVRAVSRAMLVAAVRRARSPGCPFDQLPVLSGPQGSCKSSALRVLAVDDAWFTDDLPLRDADTRRILEATAGKWIVEASELKSLLERDADDEEDRELAPRRRPAAFKAFLSRTHDEARMAYAREVSRVPRQFMVVGTTCELDYLTEATGNRRILPVTIQHFDLDRLRAMRDQLWAEAVVAEATGEPIRLADVKASS